VRFRKRSHDDVPPPDDGELQTWLQDLVDGETTARRLRKRLDESGERPEATCEVCEGSATGKIYFGLDGHLHGRRVTA
jgi:hypothetical protein